MKSPQLLAIILLATMTLNFAFSEEKENFLSAEENVDKEKGKSLTDELNPYGFGIEDEEEFLNPYGKLLKRAEEGEVKAQLELGDWYFEGKNELERDYHQALHWYRQAAAQQDKEAFYKLGELYQWGRGSVDQDLEKALQWFLKSAQKGNPVAYLKVAYLYEQGMGAVVDFKEARAWYTKAAEEDLREGYYQLGKFFFHGLGVRQDLIKAYALYAKAAAKGHPDAYNMRELSLQGLSSFQIQKARKLSKKAFNPQDY